MLTLRFSPSSPFVRKVRIGAALAGFGSEVKLDDTDTNDPADNMRKQNPLGKIPVLILEDGTALYDSRVILEYLDHRAGDGRIMPQEPGPRIEALRQQALGDGIWMPERRRCTRSAGAPRTGASRVGSPITRRRSSARSLRSRRLRHGSRP